MNIKEWFASNNKQKKKIEAMVDKRQALADDLKEQVIQDRKDLSKEITAVQKKGVKEIKQLSDKVKQTVAYKIAIASGNM